MAPPRYWTPERIAQLEAVYLEELPLRGNVRQRIAQRLGKTEASIMQALQTYCDVHALRERSLTPALDVAPPPPRPDPTDERVRELERQLTVTKDDLRDARRKLVVSDRTHAVIESLTETLTSIVAPLHFDSKLSKAPSIIDTDAEDVDAIVMMADQHTDRIVEASGSWGLERYDFNAYRARLWRWAKAVRSYLTVHLPRYRVNTLWVFHLGDAVNGDIHNMKHRNAWSNSLKAAIMAGDAQAQALAYLAEAIPNVEVVCVSGNHGRTTTQIEYEDPHDNFDYLVAKTMQLRIQGTELDGQVQFHIPKAWSAHVEIRGHLWHLNHGHGVSGTWGIPWYGFEKREGRVQRLVSTFDRDIDYYAYGHFHMPLTRPAGRGKAIHAGPWYYTDPFVLNKISGGNEPEQQLLIFSERFGRQIEIPIMVRDIELERAMRAGEWEPPFGTNLMAESLDDELGGLPIIRAEG